MSLNGSLVVGRSALLTSQAAIQVAGDNMANAATKGFNRRTVHLAPVLGQRIGNGQFVGQGVQLLSIRREVDLALQARHRNALSDENAAMIDQRFLSTMEVLQNELTDNDLSSLLSTFFNNFSELANNPEDTAIRSVVIQQGQTLANRIASMRSDYNNVIDEIDRSIGAAAKKVNELLDQITLINQQISLTETGAGQENALRDQRDSILDELAQLLDVTVIEQPNGSVNVLVNSVPIVLGGESRGIKVNIESAGGKLDVSVRVKEDGTNLRVDSGQVGGLLRQRAETVEPLVDALDNFAAQLIFQVNRLHSQGQGKMGLKDVTGTYAAKDTSIQMNADGSGLPFQIRNGSFFIHVTHDASGVRTTHEISVNGNTMSMEDLVAQINTVVDVPNVTAGITAGRQLTLQSEAGYSFTFSDDTSGALAALGINTFFTGSSAADIDINPMIEAEPSLLAAGSGHVPGSNETAMAIANLQDQPIQALGGKSLREFWQASVSDLAAKTSAANAAASSTRLVRESIHAQVQAVSGVSLDEESINLLTFQRQFQAAARYISVIDQTLQTLISLA